VTLFLICPFCNHLNNPQFAVSCALCEEAFVSCRLQIAALRRNSTSADPMPFSFEFSIDDAAKDVHPLQRSDELYVPLVYAEYAKQILDQVESGAMSFTQFVDEATALAIEEFDGQIDRMIIWLPYWLGKLYAIGHASEADQTRLWALTQNLAVNLIALALSSGYEFKSNGEELSPERLYQFEDKMLNEEFLTDLSTKTTSVLLTDNPTVKIVLSEMSKKHKMGHDPFQRYL